MIVLPKILKEILLIEAKILHGFLDKLTEDAINEIKEGGNLTSQNALPFLIKEQFTKISRIESEFASSHEIYDFKQFTTERFSSVDAELLRLDKKIDSVEERLNKKIDLVEARLNRRIDLLEERMNQKFRNQYIFLSLGFAFLSILISLK